MADNKKELAEKANKMAAQLAKETESRQKKKGGKLGLMTGFVLFGLAAPFMLPTVTLIALGMLPSLVSLITDTDRQKSGTAAVAAMNIAGVVPFVIDLWIKGQTMGNVFAILGNPMNILVILGASAIGQLILFAIPQAMALVTIAHIENRVKGLKKNLELLRESWGPDVATNKPIEQLVKDN